MFSGSACESSTRYNTAQVFTTNSTTVYMKCFESQEQNDLYITVMNSNGEGYSNKFKIYGKFIKLKC